MIGIYNNKESYSNNKIEKISCIYKHMEVLLTGETIMK